MANQLYKGDKPLATFVPQIADNLTTNDSTKALSAKQGKVLNDKIDEISTKAIVGLTNGTDYNTFINTKWGATCNIVNEIGFMCLSIKFNNTSAMSGNYKIFTIPDGFKKPSQEIIQNMPTRTGKIIIMHIFANGSIEIQDPPSLTTSDILTCIMPYF